MPLLADIAPILARVHENCGPHWSRADGNTHAPAGFCTIDVLSVLGDLGATPGDAPEIAAAVDFLAGYQNDDGSFRYARRPTRLPCITADALGALGRLGLAATDMARAGFAWLAGQQQPDGGWRCATVRPGASPETDASNPGTTLYALDAFRFAALPADRAAAAVAFLLDHWDSRAPLGPCTFGIVARFLKVEYPFLRYNLFFYVHTLAHYPAARSDPRFRAALERLRSKLKAGRLAVETPHRAWAALPFGASGAQHAALDARWAEIVALTA